jgi:hypothetical protein
VLLSLAACCSSTRLVSVPDSGEPDSGQPGAWDDAGQPCQPFSIQDCYTGTAGTDLNPPCHDGTQECSASGFWGPCLGEVTPVQNTCQDCSGNSNANLPVTFCYTGPSCTDGGSTVDCCGNLDNCPCRPGVIQCNADGSQSCYGQVLPQTAVCSDIDLACDGNIPTTTGPVQVLFLLDDTAYPSEDPIDGPGAYYFQPAVQTIIAFIQEYSAPNFAYSIVLLPGPSYTSNNEWTVLNSFVYGNSPIVVSALQAGLQPFVDLAPEPYYTLDALYAAVAPLATSNSPGPAMSINWDPPAQKVVIFFTGDEPEGSWSVAGGFTLSCAPFGNTPSISTLYQLANVAPIIFAPAGFELDYSACVSGTPGAYGTGNPFYLGDEEAMFSDLNSVLSFPCGEGDDGGITVTDAGLIEVPVGDAGCYLLYTPPPNPVLVNPDAGCASTQQGAAG